MFTARLKSLFKIALVSMVVLTLAFAFIEGAASIILAARRLWSARPLAERLHTEYDPELGWVNISNAYVADMYGPGLDVKINSQRFRNDGDFTVEVPSGKIRLMCSGDSFTFGYGVANSQAWCHLLSALDPRLETVNMGQGGYGLDQAYLWYRRDGAKLAHNVNIFAFVSTDFDRMKYDVFLGYGKPILSIAGNQLVVGNVPVPKRGRVLSPLKTSARVAMEELRSVQLLRQMFFQKASGRAQADEPAFQQLVWRMIEDLHQVSQAWHSKLLLVYLPTQGDYTPDPITDFRRQYVQQVAAREGIIFIDLVAEFRQLSAGEIPGLFLPAGVIDFPAAAGHYTTQGNVYIAKTLYEKLITASEISTMLSSLKN